MSLLSIGLIVRYRLFYIAAIGNILYLGLFWVILIFIIVSIIKLLKGSLK